MKFSPVVGFLALFSIAIVSVLLCGDGRWFSGLCLAWLDCAAVVLVFNYCCGQINARHEEIEQARARDFRVIDIARRTQAQQSYQVQDAA